MNKILLIILFSSVLIQSNCHSKEEWKNKAVYQIFTDRFAKDNGDESACNNLGDYCGGGWKGI